MKFDFKKISKNDFAQTLILSCITVGVMLLIIECPIDYQMFCTTFVILAAFFNMLRRKEDSIFSQVRTPMITGFALIANKLKTSLDMICKQEVLDSYTITQFNFENTTFSLLIFSLLFAFVLGIIIWMFFHLDEANKEGEIITFTINVNNAEFTDKSNFNTLGLSIVEGPPIGNANEANGNITRLDSLSSDTEKDRFSNLIICLAKLLCITTVIGGILSAVSRPLYYRIVSGSFDFVIFQKYLLLTSVDVLLHSAAIAILFISVIFFNTSFTSEQGGFLITDDKRIIKYKGKDKLIYVPKDFKLFMTDTFENCDSSYEIHFEEGTTEIPPLKFKKSYPNIIYPSSLTDLREYSLFIKAQNPYDNSMTIKMLLNNPVFKIIDGCLLNTKNNTLLFRVEHKESEFKIPDSVERIGKYAFDDLLLGKVYCTDESRINEVKDRYKKYINFSNGKDKEYDDFETSVISDRVQLKKISFSKNISYVHPDALELATGLREIYIPEDSDFDISESNPTRPYIKFLGKGKKITHRMIERLLHIHEKIKSGCYPNSKQLAYDLETSEPTINRDIEYLRDSRYAPIQYDFTNRGYYYTEDYELFFEK